MRTAILLVFICFLFGDPPWTPDVGVYEGTGNQNETTLGIFGGNNVCGGWNDSRLGTYHVGFGASTDGGQTWMETLMIEPSYSADGDPVICIDSSGVIYYFWLSFDYSYVGDIVLKKSTDWGQSWGPFITVTAGSPTTLDDKPWATIDDNNIFVSWYDYGGSGGLKFKRSTDYGQTWPGTGVVIGYGGNGTYPMRGTDSLVMVGWGMQDIRLNRSTDMGNTWIGQQTIISCTWNPPSTNFRLNNIPSFGTSRDRTKHYVTFSDSRLASNQLDVFFSRSTDQGLTWSTPIRLNDTPNPDNSIQFYSWLAVDPQDRIHVVWHDSREGSVNDLAQYYAYSTDLGVTWSQNYRVSDTVATAGTFIGDYNASAADDNYIYALWCDCRNGSSNPDMFFSKAPNPVEIKEGYGGSLNRTSLILRFPNPFTNRAEINYWPKDAQLFIYQSDGRKVKEITTKGIYFIVLKKDSQVLTRKLVKVE